MKNGFKLEETACPLCHLNNTNRVSIGRDRLCKREGEFQVVQCKSCGLLYTNPRPTQETMGYFYPPDYAPYQAFFVPHVEMFQGRGGLSSKIRNELKYQVLKNYYGYQELKPPFRSPALAKLPGGIKELILKLSYSYFRRHYYRIPVWQERGRALDLGCGSGAYLLLLKNIGWEVIGVDIDNNVARKVKEAKIPIFTGELNNLQIETGSFNVITMWHVLEHLHSPLETLQEIYRLLTDNGSLFIEVPNNASIVTRIFRSNWFAWDLPRHLCHFSPVSITKLLNRARFKGVKVRHLSKNTVRNSMAYWLEGRGIKFDIDQLGKDRFLFYLLKLCGAVLAFFHTSDIIFIEARKY